MTTVASLVEGVLVWSQAIGALQWTYGVSRGCTYRKRKPQIPDAGEGGIHIGGGRRRSRAWTQGDGRGAARPLAGRHAGGRRWPTSGRTGGKRLAEELPAWEVLWGDGRVAGRWCSKEEDALLWTMQAPVVDMKRRQLMGGRSRAMELSGGRRSHGQAASWRRENGGVEGVQWRYGLVVVDARRADVEAPR